MILLLLCDNKHFSKAAKIITHLLRAMLSLPIPPPSMAASRIWAITLAALEIFGFCQNIVKKMHKTPDKPVDNSPAYPQKSEV